MLFDMPLAELRLYKPERTEPADFDAFWAQTLADARSHKLDATFVPFDAGLATLDVWDVTYAGFGGQPIKGWFLAPRDPKQSPFHKDGKLSCVVEYIGYGGGRGLPQDHLIAASSGHVFLVMDTRGQGSTWRRGDTPDLGLGAVTSITSAENAPAPVNGAYPGYMTQGITAPDTYYYRRLITDAVRATEAAKAHPLVDPTRVAVTGGSQGGGLTLAVAGLVPELVLAMPDVPFMCHWLRATTINDGWPYQEIVKYCKIHRDQVDQVFNTLSYFDGLNFATRAKMPGFFSVALMDQTCPPSTVFAAYNHFAGPKDIVVYPFNDHEGGETLHADLKMRRLADVAK